MFTVYLLHIEHEHIGIHLNSPSNFQRAALVAQLVKSLPAMQETWVWSLGREDPLEECMAAHSSILAWRIPWTEEPGGLQSMGLQRVRYEWVTNTQTYMEVFLIHTFQWRNWSSEGVNDFLKDSYMVPKRKEKELLDGACEDRLQRRGGSRQSQTLVGGRRGALRECKQRLKDARLTLTVGSLTAFRDHTWFPLRRQH